MKKFLLFMLLGCSTAFASPPQTLTVSGTTYTLCAVEGADCSFSAPAHIVWGAVPPDAPSQMIEVDGPFATSPVGCFVGGLSNNDPAFGYTKACWQHSDGPPPAPTATLTANPTTITSGGSSTLTLASTNATSCTGPVSGTSGTAVVHPTTTTTYSETCTGPTSPPATATATVTVTTGPPPPTATLTASANNVPPGTQVTLTLSSTNATSCTGPVSGTSGTAVVAPTVTTTYTETCTGQTAPPASASVTVTVQQQCHNSGFTVGTPSTSAGGTANGTISADTPSTDTLRVYSNNVPFSIQVTTQVGSADTVAWTVRDTFGASIATGTFPVPAGTSTTTLPVTSSLAGYFSLSATTNGHGGSLPARGTEAPGIAAFGVLPGSVVPVVSFAHPDQHRFGMQGFNSNIAGLHDMGATDVIDDRQQSWGEPNGPNTYTPTASDLNPFFVAHSDITRLIRLDGIPPWNSSTGMFNDSYSLPVNLTEFGQYLTKVGTDSKLIHDQTYPNQSSNYYQVTWEPSLGWPQSDGTNFTTLYRTAFNALHSTDPLAVVMGPAEPFPNNNGAASGNRITASPGICAYLDGVTTHGYYNAPTVPSNPPELQDGDPVSQANALDNEMKGLRSTMQSCKPNMKLFNTEVGISYDSGMSYAAVTANHLYAQAAVAVRSHIIILGEGAQRTYYFFGPDFPDSLKGYGSFYDLTDPDGSNGATNLAPKPEAMVFAALSRVLDGTSTLGGYTLPACVAANGCVHAYAFQQLNNGKVISALWFHKNSAWTGPSSFSQTVSTSYTLSVDAAGTSGNVQVVDMFGNSTTKPYSNGQLTLTLTESPVYVVSSNSTVTKAQVTAPIGYTGQ